MLVHFKIKQTYPLYTTSLNHEKKNIKWRKQLHTSFADVHRFGEVKLSHKGYVAQSEKYILAKRS